MNAHITIADLGWLAVVGIAGALVGVRLLLRRKDDLLAEIMTANSFAEIMFLVAFILFLIEVVRLIAGRNVTWDYGWLLIVAGFACNGAGVAGANHRGVGVGERDDTRDCLHVRSSPRHVRVGMLDHR